MVGISHDVLFKKEKGKLPCVYYLTKQKQPCVSNENVQKQPCVSKNGSYFFNANIILINRLELIGLPDFKKQ